MPQDTTEMDIPQDTDYVIRPQTTEEVKQQTENDDIPEYKIQMDLSDEQEKRLTEMFWIEFDAIVAERDSRGLESKWKEKDAQWDGTLAPNDRLLFNLHVDQSKIKGLAIIRALSKAYLNSGQMADVSPRPDMAQTKNGYAICEAQTDYIDYLFDEVIKPDNTFRQIWEDSYKKFVGIGKLDFNYRREKRKRLESYEGKNEQVQLAPGVHVLKNDGLQRFLESYPDAPKRYSNLLRRLVEEKNVNIVVEYKDTVNDNATIKHVPVENFYVRNACNYWEGLKTEHCIGEEVEFTYWELMKKEKDGEFKNVDACWDETTDDKGKTTQSKEFITKSYKCIEGTYYFKINESDDEEIKLKAWWGKDKKNFLGAILYPWWSIDIDYIPFFMRLNKYGFYGDCLSVMNDVKDSNIAQDALLSLLVHGQYARNIANPIVKAGSDIEEMLLNKEWIEGMPMPVDEGSQDVSKEIAFIQWPKLDANDMMAAIGFCQRMDSNSTGVNDIAASGQNDPNDPHAPGNKTLALMQAAGINIEDYITTMEPSFNLVLTGVLQITYQMSQDDRKYRIRRNMQQVTGTNPFKTISREAMVAKTNVQTRAAGFVFEKAQERQDAMIASQAVLTNPYTGRIPMVQYKTLQAVLKTMGPYWNNFADNDIPSPDELDKQLKTVAFQAVAQFMNSLTQQSQVTGVPPQPPNPQQLSDTVDKAQNDAYNPQLAQAAQEAAKK